jgi:hypothetical protein
MKSQISRNSRQTEKRYSGVYQQQGRMITDADWNELMDLVRERLDGVLADLVGSGAPRGRAFVQKTEAGADQLRLGWGWVYVDGVPAQVRPAPDLAPVPADFQYLAQADFPAPPPLPNDNYTLYLDVWERTVTALEDPQLMDPGLHGADTCTRTQTMAQVKWCPATVDPEDGNRNPAIGAARLQVAIRQGVTESDPCDPCSDEMALDEPVGDYLFRLEIHDLSCDDSGRPVRVTLKWSGENGAEQLTVPAAGVNLPPGFSGPDWGYEFFHGPAQKSASEKQVGSHLAAGSWSPARGLLVSGWPETPEADYALVRRWDGFCTLAKNSAGTWDLAANQTHVDRGILLSGSRPSNTPGYFKAGTRVNIHLDALTLNLDLAGHPLVAGDYWLAPVRSARHQAGEVVLEESAPAGIRHRYLAVATVKGGVWRWAAALTRGEQQRRFAFPPLSALTATDIGYTIPAGIPSAGNSVSLRALLAESLGGHWALPGQRGADVAEALDALLGRLDASHLPLRKDDAACPQLRDSAAIRTVQDALNLLCSLKRDGCSTYTVFPEPGWEQVFDRLAEGENAHICFHNGDYVLSRTLTLAGKGYLKITGGGPATRIRAPRHETVLRLEDCAGVTLRDLALEAGRSGYQGDDRHLNGALTVVDCGDVTLEGVELRCAAGSRPSATCLTVRRPEGTLTEPVATRIRGCRFRMGHYQQGVLLINARKALLEDNSFQVEKKPAGLSFEKLLESPGQRLIIEKLLVGNTELLEEGATAAQGKILIAAGGYRIGFDSALPQREWNALLRAHPATGITSAKELALYVSSLGARLVREESFRTGFSAFRRWFGQLKEENPAVASRGIVCAGRLAEDIRILGNRLEGALEAIHIGLSHRAAAQSRPDVAGRIIIRDNNIRLYTAATAGFVRRGIFVGNCNHLVVEDNRLVNQRYSSGRRLDTEGIRIFGWLGRMILIRQNYLAGCSIGIRMTATGSSAGKNQWLICDNLTPSASQAVVAPNGARSLNNWA